MRHLNISRRWIAAALAAILTLSLLASALAANTAYETTCMTKVNLRKAANGSSTIIDRIDVGQTVTVLEKVGAYYKLKVGTRTGYALQKYVDGTDPSPDPTPDGSISYAPPLAVSTYPYDTTTAGYVKLRKKASQTAEVIRMLPAGALITVYSVEDSFAKVDFEGTKGYVYSGYVNLANIPTPTPKAEATPKPGAEKYTAVKKGDKNAAVLALQQVLIELGYAKTGSDDGKFGAKTEAALKVMQKRNGLTQTGVADQEFQMLVYEGTPKDNRGYRQYVTIVAPVAGATIRLNSKGSAVGKAQTRLKELGYYTGAISDTCDKATVAAIVSFEGINGVDADGVLSAADQNILYGVGALTAATVVTPSPSPTPQIPADTVRAEDKSEDAKLVQLRLIELGYYMGKATGKFDAASVTALKAFQTANGLEADGVCGVQSRAVLFAAHPVYAVATAAPVVEAAVATYPPITKENVVTIKAGSRGDAVRTLQIRLQQLGYYTSRQDGIYLTDDITAVRAFQKNNNLKVDGKAGYNTQTVLYSDAALSVAAVSTNTTTTTAASTNAVMRYGSVGNDVLELQNRLIKLGYLAITADGNFKASTKSAVVAFQKANNLVADGVVGTKTLAALNSSSATDNLVPYVTLRVGSASNAVKDLQNRLIALGYLTGKADGKFGTQTSLALMAFQRANNLKADGVLGSATTRALNKTTTVTASGTTASTTTAAAPVLSSGSVSAASVRYANWYTEIRAKVRQYPNVTVYDFTTGISWRLNIFSNGAHADAEPLTAADTANMNRAFGGVTTWTPKAVWVVLSDGTVYMASTHNTPHSPSHISDNNFNGHLCVHFPRTEAQVEAIGSYATSHQKAIDLGWAATQKRAGK